MQIRLKYEALNEERTYTAKQARMLLNQVKAKLRAVSLAAERRVKNDMPVDTGRARASWSHWSPGDIRKGGSGASAADAHYKETDGGLTIEQGSNVEYIEALNDGSSAQAPAGFIDSAEENAGQVLEREIDEVIRGFTV